NGYNAGFLRAAGPSRGAGAGIHNNKRAAQSGDCVSPSCHPDTPTRTEESVTMSKLNKSIIAEFESAQITRELPKFSQGDTVVVNVKVKEGNRERVQAYEGVVIATKNAGLNSSFTVRKISHGYGVERVFQTFSPIIDSVEVKRQARSAPAS